MPSNEIEKILKLVPGSTKAAELSWLFYLSGEVRHTPASPARALRCGATSSGWSAPALAAQSPPAKGRSEFGLHLSPYSVDATARQAPRSVYENSMRGHSPAYRRLRRRLWSVSDPAVPSAEPASRTNQVGFLQLIESPAATLRTV
jgi:hypothetical protein